MYACIGTQHGVCARGATRPIKCLESAREQTQFLCMLIRAHYTLVKWILIRRPARLWSLRVAERKCAGARRVYVAEKWKTLSTPIQHTMTTFGIFIATRAHEPTTPVHACIENVSNPYSSIDILAAALQFYNTANMKIFYVYSLTP